MTKQKAILAVSGGIDSMVMLDWFCHDVENINYDIIVAHFDHGTRESSKEDAEFVRKKCEIYKVDFASERANLGEHVSEEAARKSRYDFLHRLAKLHNADVYTAHHLNDLVESIAINLLRGTGWRGLAVFGANNIHRPFLENEYAPSEFRDMVPMTKTKIYKYAAAKKITYREDPTNSSDVFLRNRLRHRMNNFPEMTDFYKLWKKQQAIKSEIDILGESLLHINNDVWERKWFRVLDDQSALELLRIAIERKGIRVTRPQVYNFLGAIRTYAPGKFFNLPGDHLVKIQRDIFIL